MGRPEPETTCGGAERQSHHNANVARNQLVGATDGVGPPYTAGISWLVLDVATSVAERVNMDFTKKTGMLARMSYGFKARLSCKC